MKRNAKTVIKTVFQSRMEFRICRRCPILIAASKYNFYMRLTI
jgi:hypothetical protein